jgi:carboxymethylenebutenolidase
LACHADSVRSASGKNDVKVDLYMPEGAGPFPAVLVLHTSGGVRGPELDYAKRLAQNGYAALVPYYFDAHNLNWQGRSRAISSNAAEIVDDLTGAIDWLKKNPKIDAQHIGAVGFSMGGYFAMLLAGKGLVAAGVSNYGVLSGIGPVREPAIRFTDVFGEKSSPVLIMHGDRDGTQNVAGAHRLSALLDQRNVAHEMHIYPGADHQYDRGPAYRSPEAEDSWNRASEFFAKYLATRGARR